MHTGMTRQSSPSNVGDDPMDYSSSDDDFYTLYRSPTGRSSPLDLGRTDADINITDDTSSPASEVPANDTACSPPIIPSKVSQNQFFVPEAGNERPATVSRVSQVVQMETVAQPAVESYGKQTTVTHDRA